MRKPMRRLEDTADPPYKRMFLHPTEEELRGDPKKSTAGDAWLQAIFSYKTPEFHISEEPEDWFTKFEAVKVSSRLTEEIYLKGMLNIPNPLYERFLPKYGIAGAAEALTDEDGNLLNERELHVNLASLSGRHNVPVEMGFEGTGPVWPVPTDLSTSHCQEEAFYQYESSSDMPGESSRSPT